MLWDIGLRGLAILLGYALVFGVAAQILLWSRATHWLWLIGTVAFFGGGLFASEVLFGTATIDQLQPIEDGLMVDESIIGGVIVGVAAVLVGWYMTRRSPIGPVTQQPIMR
jgi:hypothetical protein